MMRAFAQTAKGAAQVSMPREHGATAMLLTPFFAASILLRHFYWPELVALTAIMAAFAMKDPLVMIARQHFVWKQKRPETRAAIRQTAVLGLLALGSGVALMVAGDWHSWIPFILGAGAFTALAVAANVLNRQRSVWFQIASAAALSSTCVVACLAAIGRIPDWCWLLWIFSAMQATAGILVVHARLDARIAARKDAPSPTHRRRAAYVAQAAVMAAAIVAVVAGRLRIAAGLMLTAVCYVAELRRQQDPASLRVPLTRVGLQALAQSIVYTLVIIVGLWRH